MRSVCKLFLIAARHTIIKGAGLFFSSSYCFGQSRKFYGAHKRKKQAQATMGMSPALAYYFYNKEGGICLIISASSAFRNEREACRQGRVWQLF